MELPLSVVQGADLPSLEPARDAVEVEGVVADTPGHSALLTGGRGLVRLALYTWEHITKQLFQIRPIWQQRQRFFNYSISSGGTATLCYTFKLPSL